MQAYHGVTGNNPCGSTEKMATLFCPPKFTFSQVSWNLFPPCTPTPCAARLVTSVSLLPPITVATVCIFYQEQHCVSRSRSTVVASEAVTAEPGKTSLKALTLTCPQELPRTYTSSSKLFVLLGMGGMRQFIMNPQ